MAALELSYDRDWVRFRTSFFWSSGDSNPKNNHATGFDTILDNPNFAGGDFSYWQRQAIPLFGVNLTKRMSLVPDLRSSKIEGQSQLRQPGARGCSTSAIDFELTPKLRLINNVNFLWFDQTESWQMLLFQDRIMINRRGPKHRFRVPPAAEQQCHYEGRLIYLDSGSRVPRPVPAVDESRESLVG